MRFIYSILCICGIAFLFAWNAQAHDSNGGQSPQLKNLMLDEGSAKYLSELCDKEGHLI